MNFNPVDPTILDNLHVNIINDLSPFIDSKCVICLQEYELGDKVDVVGNLEINSYNGRESIQILLKDMRKSIGNIK
jgi:hypothetical protein